MKCTMFNILLRAAWSKYLHIYRRRDRRFVGFVLQYERYCWPDAYTKFIRKKNSITTKPMVVVVFFKIWKSSLFKIVLWDTVRQDLDRIYVIWAPNCSKSTTFNATNGVVKNMPEDKLDPLKFFSYKSYDKHTFAHFHLFKGVNSYFGLLLKHLFQPNN